MAHITNPTPPVQLPQHKHRQLVVLIAILFALNGVYGLIQLALPYLGHGSRYALPYMLGISGSVEELITTPYRLLTYFWLHTNFSHLLCNLFLIYFFGRAFLRVHSFFRLLATLLSGAWIAGIGYPILRMLFETLGGHIAPLPLLGASGATMALTFSVAVQGAREPFGPWRPRTLWIALLFLTYSILLDTLSLNLGGLLAHLVAVLWGCALGICSKRRGIDLAYPLTFLIWKASNLLKRQNQTAHSPIDPILNKIRRSGYSSLSQAERDQLVSYQKRTGHES